MSANADGAFAEYLVGCTKISSERKPAQSSASSRRRRYPLAGNTALMGLRDADAAPIRASTS